MGRFYGAAKMLYQVIRPLKEKIIVQLADIYYKNSTDKEIRKAMHYAKKNGRMKTFNDPFTEKYENCIYDIRKDKQSGMYYVDYHGHVMYFSKDYFSVKSCQNYLRGIFMEQDKKSPHKYLSEEFCVDDGSIVIDAGAAEGNFSLDIVGRCSKIILVECNKNWIEALKRTFAAEIAEGKVEIVAKILSDKNTKKEISIDALFARYGRIDFIKMDIEGGEERALKGAAGWMEQSRSPVKMAVCAYHTPEAFHEIRKILKGRFQVSCSKGYLYFNEIWNFQPPYLRRGVIRATKIIKPD